MRVVCRTRSFARSFQGPPYGNGGSGPSTMLVPVDRESLRAGDAAKTWSSAQAGGPGNHRITGAYSGAGSMHGGAPCLLAMPRPSKQPPAPHPTLRPPNHHASLNRLRWLQAAAECPESCWKSTSHGEYHHPWPERETAGPVPAMCGPQPSSTPTPPFQRSTVHRVCRTLGARAKERMYKRM